MTTAAQMTPEAMPVLTGGWKSPGYGLRLLLLLAIAGCTQFEPPIDVDTSTGDSESGDGIDDEVMFDGDGMGQMIPARMRDTPQIELMPTPKYGLVIGAPAETWETMVGAGQGSLVLDDDLGHLASPKDSPSTYVENLRSSHCPPEQRFAWDLLPNRGLGGAITYFSRNHGDNGTRECQCADDYGRNDDCRPFDEILVGSFPDEEFGAALVAADFDCDGIDDLAVGAPGAALPDNDGSMIASAGAAYIFRSHGELLGDEAPQILRQGAFEVGGTPESGDRFGQTLVAGNFDGSRRVSNNYSCYDLVVAAPGEDDGAGQLQLFEGDSRIELGVALRRGPEDPARWGLRRIRRSRG